MFIFRSSLIHCPKVLCVQRAILLFCVIYCATNVASAQTISGAGARECSAFSAAVERDSVAALDSFMSWSQGFTSGINASGNSSADIAIDHGGLFLWLAQFCAAEPNATVYEALSEMIGLNSR